MAGGNGWRLIPSAERDGGRDVQVQSVFPPRFSPNTPGAKVLIQTWSGKPALHRPNEKCLQAAAGVSVVVRHYDGWPILQSISSTALL